MHALIFEIQKTELGFISNLCKMNISTIRREFPFVQYYITLQYVYILFSLQQFVQQPVVMEDGVFAQIPAAVGVGGLVPTVKYVSLLFYH